MNSIETKQQELVEDFSLFDNWEDKYAHVIDLGKSLPSLDASYKTDDYLIKGCQSKVWLHAEEKDGTIVFHADSDAVLPKGIVAMLLYVFSNEPIEDIMTAKADFIEEIGLHEFLSPNRANGLLAMIKQIKFYAIALRTQKK